MPGWGKLVAGALIGVAGTVYATNEEFRKKLPSGARDLPVAIRRRFETAVAAGRQASSARRAEILRALEEHEAEEHARSAVAASRVDASPSEEAYPDTAPPLAAPEAAADGHDGRAGEEPAIVDEDATRPLKRIDQS